MRYRWHRNQDKYPYYYQEPLRKLLDLDIDEDIFEKVTDEEPMTSYSPTVHVQPKPNFAIGTTHDNFECGFVSIKQALETKRNFTTTSCGRFHPQVS